MQIVRASLTLLAALAAGWACAMAGVPLGWLVGAMLAMVLAGLIRLPAVQPVALMPWVKGAVGAMLGASIPVGVLGHLAGWWPTILAMFAVMALAGALH
jgi:uncharacterized membrane protein AbrB (regulator of aidB expression)